MNLDFSQLNLGTVIILDVYKKQVFYNIQYFWLKIPQKNSAWIINSLLSKSFVMAKPVNLK